MGKRVIAILGAGTVLGFDYDRLIRPDTRNITQIVVEQRLKGLGEESWLIKRIYDKLTEASKTEYLGMHPAVRNYEPIVSFEDLFDVIETLHS